MAMTMTGEVQLPASREAVWAKLNDAEVLKACIPGCEELDKLSDTEFQAVAVDQDRPGQGALQRQGASDRSRSAERLQDFRRGRWRRCRLCQRRRHASS